MKYVTLAFISFGISSCVTSYGTYDNEKLKVNSNINKISTKYVVTSSTRDFIWADCSELGDYLVKDLISKAKSVGGDSIDNLRFETGSGFNSKTPVCEKGLGWFLIYFVGGLGPWVQVSTAQANVIKYDLDNVMPLHKETKLEKTNKKNIVNCASLVIGDKDKLVCGDSKDRVIEKWGNPTSASPSLGQWRYDLCVIEFLDGRLNNYGGKCDFQKISNDSFEGHRILANNSEILEKELNSNQLSSNKNPNCLKVDIFESVQTMRALMGNPVSLTRNDVNDPNGNCDNFVGNSLKCNDCADTIATYSFPNSGDKTCKIYIRKKQIFHIDKNCPISCDIFE